MDRSCASISNKFAKRAQQCRWLATSNLKCKLFSLITVELVFGSFRHRNKVLSQILTGGPSPSCFPPFLLAILVLSGRLSAKNPKIFAGCFGRRVRAKDSRIQCPIHSIDSKSRPNIRDNTINTFYFKIFALFSTSCLLLALLYCPHTVYV